MKDRYYSEVIELTDEHRELAKRLYLRWNDEMEWGCPEVDAKRPFGNSDMPGDVAEILGWTVDPDHGLSQEQIDRAKQLHFEMGYVLKAALLSWLDWSNLNETTDRLDQISQSSPWERGE